jgi:hypothetical protein
MRFGFRCSRQTEGVRASAAMPRDGDRTALHCAGSVWVYGDSLRESYIFSLLQHTPHWLEQVARAAFFVRDWESFGCCPRALTRLRR